MDISIEGLTKTYHRTRALDALDLEIRAGMHGLLGANGAGKTTLMRILAGVIRPTSGRVVVGGRDLAVAASRVANQRTLGYLPQDLGLYPDLTGWETLDYFGLVKGMRDREIRRRRVAAMLETVGLTAHGRRRVGAYSGGMRQRLGIAQALINEPQLLIVDEPTAGLDPEERIRFRNLLVELAGDRTVLLSTHIVDDVAQTCSDLTVLAGGHAVFRGSPADLVRAASGRVWLVEGDRLPAGDVHVVATVSDGRTARYRVVAERQPSPDAVRTDPVLEDGYVAVMHACAQVVGR
jgi:ABC-type multidrug transport system ATPase subunit